MSFQKLQLLFGGQEKLAEMWVLAAEMQTQKSDMPTFTQTSLGSCVFCWLLLWVLPVSQCGLGRVKLDTHHIFSSKTMAEAFHKPLL